MELGKEYTRRSSLGSDMDGGPDSGLATSATWGATDQTISETSGVELTEEIQQDGALEGPKSVSSSISSDCCVWDSFAPPQPNSLGSWVENAPHAENTEINADFVDRILEELVEKSRAQSRQDDKGENSSDINTDCSTSHVGKQNCFIDASSLLDETELQSLTCAPYLTEGNLISISDGSKNLAKDSGSINNKVTHEAQKSFIQDVSNREPLPEDHGLKSTDYDVPDGSQKSNACINETSQNAKDSAFREEALADCPDKVPKECNKEENTPSLIRSNTFELETEDGHLALLRQDYERRQGSLIFQRCMSQCSGPLSDVSSDHQHFTSLTESLPEPYLSQLTGMSLIPTHVVDEDIHTPDSLNSDAPEAMFQEKLSAVGSRSKSEHDSYVNVFDTVEEEGLDTEDVPDPAKEVNKSETNRYNRVECMPIVSGGVSETYKEVQSPLFSRRKTECAPILSGAAPPLSPDPIPVQSRPKPSLVSSLSSAWVVDISDITKSPESVRKKNSNSHLGSMTELQGESKDHPVFFNALSKSESRTSTSGLGFFVDLSSPDECKASKLIRQMSDSGQVGAGKGSKSFTSEDSMNPREGDGARRRSFGSTKVIHSPERKLFSMFIDIGNEAKSLPKTKPELPTRLKTVKGEDLKSVVNDVDSSANHGGTTSSNSRIDGKGSNLITFLDTCERKQPDALNVDAPNSKKNSFFMIIETDSPVGKRRTLTSSLKPPSNRHSLSQEKDKDKDKDKPTFKKQHQRSHSSSIGKSAAFNSMDRSLSSALSDASRHLSSQSLCETQASVEDAIAMKPVFSSFHSSLPSKSQDPADVSSDHISSNNHLSGRYSNESSLCSLDTYSIHTSENSTAADDSFEKVSLKGSNDKHSQSDRGKPFRKSLDKNDVSFHQQSNIPTIVKPHSHSNTSGGTDGSFVRLSDLDKQPVKLKEDVAPTALQRMSRSIPETSWIESKLLMTRSTGGGCNSSSRSLSRLFPHFSTSGSSMGRSKTSSVCSPAGEDPDTMRSSQMSDISSMQSSAGLEYSTESTDISSGRGSPTTQLGDDLLKMFLEEVSTDVVVEVGGRRIKAHKCILSSRCQYFAAILSGGWVESAGNVISLQGFSYSCVHFALCHIYSGASTIPEHISIVELATLADMLCLEGLKEVIMYTLKVKYCHFFHKPCAVCSVGVLECLPLAAAYGLDDIYRKSLRWITKFFVKIWPTKAFTALPRELIDKCYQQHIVHMTEDNILETIMCCDKLLATIPTVRWAEPVFTLTSRLLEACIKFMADNFSVVLTTENFLALGREVPWNVSRLQESLVSAAERLPPDQSCRSYACLSGMLNVAQGPDPPSEMTWHPNFLDLLVQLRDQSERSLIRQAVRAARTPGWGLMPTALRCKIQEAACLVLTPAEHTSSRFMRAASDSTAYNQRSSHSRSLDLRQVKMAMVQHARRMSGAHDQNQSHGLIPVKVPHPIKSSSIVRRSAPPSTTTNKLPDKAVASKPAPQGRPKTWPAQVKSRYLEKRPTHTKQAVELSGQPTDAPVPQRRSLVPPVKGIFISSSDSSRNSSPAMKRSGNTSEIIKTSDSSIRLRAATIAGTHQHSAPSQVKEDGLSRSSDNIAKRSASQTNENKFKLPSSSKTPPVRRKGRGTMTPDSLCNGDKAADSQDINEAAVALTVSSKSNDITMSNDSLATESSCDDSNMLVKDVKTNRTSKHTMNSDKGDSTVQRTPLGLTNKRAAPSNALKKPSVNALKALNINTTASNNRASPLPKRSVSHTAKPTSASSTSSSRLSIPLRTSRSVSSVPDKANVKPSSTAETVRKPLTKGTARLHSLTTPLRTSTSVVKTANSSMAGKASISKSNRANNNNVNKNGNAVISGKRDEDNAVENARPTVGPRSGTFLKDEPTVLLTTDVKNGHD